MAERSKEWVCCCSLAEIAGLIPLGSWMFVFNESCVLSGSLCYELITRPKESYQLWCVVCDLETSRIRKPCPALGHSATRKNGLYNFGDHERYLTELETINVTESTKEERMIDKIILWNEIPNAENIISCNTLCSKRGEMHKQNVDG